MGNGTRTRKTFSGVVIPMVTPLTADGELDEPAARRLIESLVAGGAQGIFVLGTTGEGPSIPRDMRSRLVHLALEFAAGRAQVYAGIPSTVVSESIEMGREYLKRGAAAVVAQLPSYYSLTPDEQFHYFVRLVERIRGPILLYDIPAGAHMGIDSGVIEHLRAFPNLVGIKDSSGSLARLEMLLEAYADDPGYSVLVGSTSLAAEGLRRGADGFVPSAGNINPALCARLYASAIKGDHTLMHDLQLELDALQAEFVVEGFLGQGIARLKKRLASRGLCGPSVMPPLEQEEG